MIVEVTGVSSSNQGAHLMLLAIQDGMAPYWRGATYALNSRSWLRFDRRYRSPYKPVAHVPVGAMTGVASIVNATIRSIPPSVMKAIGIVSPRNVSCLMDASGFSYSDQLSLGNMEARGEYYSWHARRGTPVILLPQAFGPFRSQRSKSLVRRIVDSASLVYCRDEASYGHLTGACGISEKIRMGPDFTLGLLSNTDMDHAFDPSGKVGIIPNMRMFDKTDERVGQAYWNFLATALDELVRREVPVHIIVQGESKDVDLAHRLRRSIVASEIEVSASSDPLETKRLVGRCRAVITSRFHGAINALSFGRPVLVTSWSHKYEQLMSAFGIPQFVADLGADEHQWRQDVSDLLNMAENNQLAAKILAVKNSMHSESVRMWKDIAEVVDAA